MTFKTRRRTVRIHLKRLKYPNDPTWGRNAKPPTMSQITKLLPYKHVSKRRWQLGHSKVMVGGGGGEE